MSRVFAAALIVALALAPASAALAQSRPLGFIDLDCQDFAYQEQQTVRG